MKFLVKSFDVSSNKAVLCWFQTWTLFFVLEFLYLPNEKRVINEGKPEVPWTVTVNGKIR